jgi:DNA-binding NarL/FixJ family response regulator
VRIVIADDHRIVRDGIRWMLDDEPDMEIIGEAQDGQSLLELLERVSPDVVLSTSACRESGGSRRSSG